MRMRIEPRAEGECISCNKTTKYICINCAIDIVKFIHLCENDECKKKHDLKCHTEVLKDSVRNERV